MTSRTVALDGALHDYLLSISLSEHPVMRDLREFTATHRMAKMQIAPEQGQFMAWLAQLIGARRYLEIGVFTGYSALAVTLAMPEDGRTLACDVSETFTAVARDYWARAGVAERIELVLQPALATLRQQLDAGQAGQYDLAFIDADKPAYRDYYEACLQLVRPGGVIAIDNILLNGRVVEPQSAHPRSVEILRAFNAGLKHDDRVDQCILPMGDGMTLLRRR